MRAFNERMIFGCKAGVLWQDDDGYIWKPQEGKTLYEERGDIKVKEIDTSCMYMYVSGRETEGIRVLEMGGITLMGDLDTGEWDEVDCIEIKDTDYVVYVAKNKIDLSVIINKNGECRHLTSVMSIIANEIIFGEPYSKYDKEIPEFTKNLSWKVGHVNWQGKPINEKQKLKLKMSGCLDEDPFKDYDAVRLDNIGLEVYWSSYNEFEGPVRSYHGCHRTDDKHIFYTV